MAESFDKAKSESNPPRSEDRSSNHDPTSDLPIEDPAGGSTPHAGSDQTRTDSAKAAESTHPTGGDGSDNEDDFVLTQGVDREELFADRYRLLDQIGEGGMGSVWVARQTAPVKRSVAIKLIREGLDSKSILRRFEVERQALAMMDHPNIAQVLDAGETQDGQPYFVMELVKGLRITQFCDEAKLNLRQRLELFVLVCQAIQHAHHKGIIHRDIKPSNVLVTTVDGNPVPKVIDFGVAKAAGQPLTDESVQTGLGYVVGTPEYMSPEQADLSELDIDTRSDIYALGVLLYEILTGSTPVDKRSREKDVSVMEILRVVREEEAPRPSHRVNSSADRATVSTNRDTDTSLLARQLRKELDWIVMKALEKDRSRRYETANGLASDIKRYLSGEPVHAHPPSVGYRTKKFLARHRAAVTAAALVFVALIAGITGTSLSMMEARRQKEIAERNGAVALRRLEEIKAEKERADDEAALSATINGFLQDGILGQVETSLRFDPRFRADPNLTVRAALDRASSGVGTAFKDRPLVESGIRHTLGNAYRSVGEYERSVEHLLRAYEIGVKLLGEDTVDNWVNLHNVALSQGLAGRTVAARKSLERALTGLRKHLGAAHSNTLTTMNALAMTYQDLGEPRKAMDLLGEAIQLAEAKHGKDHYLTLSAQQALAQVHNSEGRNSEAIRILERVHQKMVKSFGADHLKTLATHSALGQAYDEAGRSEDAIRILESVYESERTQLGDDHPDSLTNLHNLAGAYASFSKNKRAIELYEKVLSKLRKRLGDDNSEVLVTMNALSGLYRETGEYDKALKICDTVRQAQLKSLGPEHRSTLNTFHTWAGILRDTGEIGKAATVFEQVRKGRIKTLGLEHPDTLKTLSSLAGVLRATGELDKAIAYLEQACKVQTKVEGRDHPLTLSMLSNLGGAYRENGDPEKAIKLLTEVRDAKVRTLGARHPDIWPTLNNLSVALADAGRVDESLKLGEQVHEGMAEAYGANHRKTLNALANVAVGYWKRKNLKKSVPMFEEVYRRQKATLGDDNPATLLTAANLGINYRDNKQMSKALPLMEQAYAASRKYPRLRWVGTQLLGVYAGMGKAEQTKSLAEKLSNSLPTESTRQTGQVANQYYEIGLALLRIKAWLEAQAAFRKCLQIQESIEPTGWWTANIKRLLGKAHLEAEEYKKAEPLLTSAYKGLESDPSRVHKSYLINTARLLVRCYKKTKQSKLATEWQARIVELRK